MNTANAASISTAQRIAEGITEQKVFAIVRGVSVDDIEGVVKALLAGGIRLLEVTFEHNGPMDNTLACVTKITEQYGDRLICGVGTALTVEQIHAAKKAGAKFVVSPNIDAEIIKLTKKLGMVSIPGALTPTEAVIADQAGADYVKLFPGGLFGIPYFKAVGEVLKSIKLIAVGGVNAANAKEFLDAGAVGVGIGGYLVSAKDLKTENLELKSERLKKLTARAQSLVAAIN